MDQALWMLVGKEIVIAKVKYQNIATVCPLIFSILNALKDGCYE
jgi:hypothetical protein